MKRERMDRKEEGETDSRINNTQILLAVIFKILGLEIQEEDSREAINSRFSNLLLTEQDLKTNSMHPLQAKSLRTDNSQTKNTSSPLVIAVVSIIQAIENSPLYIK